MRFACSLGLASAHFEQTNKPPISTE